MGLLVTLIAGLVLWIVLWSQGTKGFDAFLLTILMVLVAVGARVVWPMLPGNRKDDSGPITPNS
jgi:Mn2+/Fe2+ NRAMP family transporter